MVDSYLPLCLEVVEAGCARCQAISLKSVTSALCNQKKVADSRGRHPAQQYRAARRARRYHPARLLCVRDWVTRKQHPEVNTQSYGRVCRAPQCRYNTASLQVSCAGLRCWEISGICGLHCVSQVVADAGPCTLRGQGLRSRSSALANTRSPLDRAVALPPTKVTTRMQGPPPRSQWQKVRLQRALLLSVYAHHQWR